MAEKFTSEQERGGIQAAEQMYQDARDALKAWKASYPTPKGDDKGNDYLAGVLGDDKAHLEESFEVLEDFVREKTLKLSRSKNDALEHAVAALEAMAGGKADGGSWKEKLTNESPWEDIEREATYHMVHKDGTRLHNSLDVLYTDMKTKRDAYVQVFKDLADSRVTSRSEEESTPRALLDRIAAADSKASVTHTESTFFEILSSTGSDRTRKIQARIESMSKKQITSEDMLEGMWRKVMLLTAPRRRSTPATPSSSSSKAA